MAMVRVLEERSLALGDGLGVAHPHSQFIKSFKQVQNPKDAPKQFAKFISKFIESPFEKIL
jgi:hypothetical protein